MTRLEELITSAANLTLDGMTLGVQNQVKRSFIRAFGRWFEAVVPSSEEAAILASVAGVGGKKALAVGGSKFPLPWAAFVNGYKSQSGHQEEFHHGAGVSPTPVVASILLALAQDGPVSGADLVLALAVGMEVAVRVGLILGCSHRERGWYPSATAGLFGAVVAGAKLRGFALLEFRNVMGLAASLATGTVEARDVGGLKHSLARSSYNAVTAVMLAERGFTSNPQAVDGKGGFLQIASSSANMDWLRFPNNTEWEILNLVNTSPPSGPYRDIRSEEVVVDSNEDFLTHAQEHLTRTKAEMLLKQLWSLESVEDASGMIESALADWKVAFNRKLLS
ncbi:MmgE/PrpD family protein [Alicyclobacillus curvatus]|jgi:2-methylcitrate dehydratase PrpD|nr:MmgE/PrpD family protein [Alicyclobacillus curvatus]